MTTSNSLQAEVVQQKWDTLPAGAESLYQGALPIQAGASAVSILFCLSIAGNTHTRGSWQRNQPARLGESGPLLRFTSEPLFRVFINSFLHTLKGGGFPLSASHKYFSFLRNILLFTEVLNNCINQKQPDNLYHNKNEISQDGVETGLRRSRGFKSLALPSTCKTNHLQRNPNNICSITPVYKNIFLYPSFLMLGTVSNTSKFIPVE